MIVQVPQTVFLHSSFINKDTSFSGLPNFAVKDLLISSSKKASSIYDIATELLVETPIEMKALEADRERDGALFSKDLYDNIENFLDKEELNIVPLSPYGRCRKLKLSKTVVLTTKFFSRSEADTPMSSNSHHSDTTLGSGPSFWIRRAVSGGNKSSDRALTLPDVKSNSIQIHF